MNNNYIINLITSQSFSFKILIELLKDILKDINFVINNSTNDKSLEMSAIDKNNTILIKIKLYGDSFDKFFFSFSQPIYNIGVNMNSLSKILKYVNKDDILSIFINSSDENNLCIKIENKEKNMITLSKLKILDIDDNCNLKNDLMNYSIAITIPSNKFHKIIKDMSNIGDKIWITFIDVSTIKDIIENISSNDNFYCLIFNVKSEYEEKKTIISNINNSNINNFINDNIIDNEEYFFKNNISFIKNTYDIKNLLIFSKCHQLCDYVEIYIKNNFPIILKYKIIN